VTAGTIIFSILLPFGLLLLWGMNQTHRDVTGVDFPTRGGMRRIRRNARKKGISEAAAYQQWLNRKQRTTSPRERGAIDFVGSDERPPRTKTKPTAEELAQEAADEPLRALASARKLSLHRQFNGLYYFINRGSGPATLIPNPVGGETQFTRKQAELFLSGTTQRPLPPTPDPVEAYSEKWLNRIGRNASSAIVNHDDRPLRPYSATTPDPPSHINADGPLQAIAAARNWSLHRQLDGLYYILNHERSPATFVRNPTKPDQHEFTRDEVEKFLSARQ
jgi:hypothetical protein